MAAKRYSPAIRARMAELRRQGWTLNAISILFDCSVKTVTYHCRQRGVPPRPSHRTFVYRPREARP